MKKFVIGTIIFIVLCLAVSFILFIVIPENENSAVRKMKINDVNMSLVTDGLYKGQYAYGHYTYKAEVEVKNHKILNIRISHGRKSAIAKKAEGVVTKVLKYQTPNVDVVSGATTTSKAILKAIELALKK